MQALGGASEFLKLTAHASQEAKNMEVWSLSLHIGKIHHVHSRLTPLPKKKNKWLAIRRLPLNIHSLASLLRARPNLSAPFIGAPAHGAAVAPFRQRRGFRVGRQGARVLVQRLEAGVSGGLGQKKGQGNPGKWRHGLPAVQFHFDPPYLS